MLFRLIRRCGWSFASIASNKSNHCSQPLEPLSNVAKVEQWRFIPERLLIAVDQLALAKTAVTLTGCIFSRDPGGTTFYTFKRTLGCILRKHCYFLHDRTIITSMTTTFLVIKQTSVADLQSSVCVSPGVGWSRRASSTSLCIMFSACTRSRYLTPPRSRLSHTRTETHHCTPPLAARTT